MKERMKKLMWNFEWRAFIGVGLLMAGGSLLVITLVASLINASWTPLLLLIPGILCIAISAGVTM